MDNFEAFESYLDAKDIKYKEDSFDDGDRFIVIPQKIQNGVLLNVLLIFSRIKIKILVLGIGSLEDESKREALYEIFNKFNLETGFFKMYLRGNDVCVECDMATDVFDGEFNPKKFMNFIMAALFTIDNSYRDIVKILWF